MQTTTDRLRFLLDGEVVELAGVDPIRTVLQYLREDCHRTGTKEGCAEGDCGACTVVVNELDRGGGLRTRAINACIQFLPTLDGKGLLTVESLRGAAGELHPVQRAMVDCHGSQCGFCTPGFVMSLFALYKNSAAPGRVAIDDALAGNLCRCTGYRPIVDSARTMYSHAPATTDDWRLAPAGVDAGVSERVAALEAMQGEAMLAIEHDRRRFFAPRSAAELAECCARHPDATLLAGGTDVGLWVTKQLRELTTVVYTGRVAELHALDEVDGMLSIGAAVSLSDAMPVIVRHFPTLEELLLRFASPPIRNAGTLGGNVANGSPIGDSMPALLAIDTVVRLRSREGSRDLPLSDFYLDYQETALLPGEFVEQVVMPLLQPDEHLRSYKVSKRFDQDISAVCGAFRVRLDDRLRIDDVRIAYGGLAATPKRATACEQALIGREFVEAGIADAMDALDDDFEPISDMRASDEYRRRISRNLLLRFYRETAAELDGKPIVRIYDYGRQKRA